MDIRDPESTKLVMDTFLAKIAFSMSTSTVGILLSVVMTVYNNFVSPERAFSKTVERFERNLFRLWSRCDNNQLPEEIPGFDEHRDATEALISLTIDKVIEASGKVPSSERDPREAQPKPAKAHAPLTPPTFPGEHAPPPPPDGDTPKGDAA
jgi:hypothetical protein